MNTGKELESLIKEVEEILLPDGFKISTNTKLFEEGVQTDEFDLIISGPLGTTTVSWLIECRDRPSEGAQSKAWIQQLFARRADQNFSKVTAVSTTGFSPGAISYAKRCGVDLHNVDHLSSNDIISWWNQTELPLVEQYGEMYFANPLFDANLDKEILNQIQTEYHDIKPDAKILFSTKDDTKYSFLDAWRIVLPKIPGMFDGIKPNSEKRKIVLQANYPNPSNRYKISVNEFFVDIVQINFHAFIQVNEKMIPTNKIIKVSNPIEKTTIDQLVNYQFTILDQDIELTWHKIDNSQNFVIGVKATKRS